MTKLGVALLGAVVACLLAAGASAKLTPVEQTWAKPMIAVWNQQNVALQVVLQAASAKDALVYGSANNKKLNVILNTFVVCGPAIKKAGTPPSPRLKAFADALGTACTHDTNGAHDIAKVVGAVRKGKTAQLQALLQGSAAEFKLGTAALTKAYKSLLAIGGANIFKA